MEAFKALCDLWLLTSFLVSSHITSLPTYCALSSHQIPYLMPQQVTRNLLKAPQFPLPQGYSLYLEGLEDVLLPRQFLYLLQGSTQCHCLQKTFLLPTPALVVALPP